LRRDARRTAVIEAVLLRAVPRRGIPRKAEPGANPPVWSETARYYVDVARDDPRWDTAVAAFIKANANPF
jgi:hypothetical protein